MPPPSLAGRVLVVADGDVDARAIFGTVLRHHGATVHEAASGAECLRLVEAVEPYAVLLELALPRMDGTAVAARLAADPHTAHIPVLAVTADTHPANRDAALAAGRVAVLQARIGVAPAPVPRPPSGTEDEPS